MRASLNPSALPRCNRLQAINVTSAAHRLIPIHPALSPYRRREPKVVSYRYRASDATSEGDDIGGGGRYGSLSPLLPLWHTSGINQSHPLWDWGRGEGGRAWDMITHKMTFCLPPSLSPTRRQLDSPTKRGHIGSQPTATWREQK